MGPKLPLCLALWLSWSLTCLATTNVTLEDTDPRIMYYPPEDWRTSTTPCPQCLNPSNLGDITWHDGSLIVNPSPKRGAVAKGSSIKETAVVSATTPHRSPVKRRRISTREDDADMSLSLEFDGSAVYLYAIVPLGMPTVSVPTAMNLTFILDDAVVDHFVKETSVAPSTTLMFLPPEEIFSSRDLDQDITHTLQVNIGPNSVLLLDRIIYTQEDEDPSSDADRKKKISTFAGAVAGSFGVLIILAVGLGISLVRRRRRALRREEEERANRAENPSEFIPRYFPGTLPPPYSESPSVMRESPSANRVTLSPLLSSPPISRAPSRTSSSHPSDEPLSPVTQETTIPTVPPPSFAEAISNPLSIPDAIPDSHSNESSEQAQAGTQPIERDPEDSH